MVSAKKLLKLARRWQKFVAIKRKRITFQQTTGNDDNSNCSTSAMVEKGHFVVYSVDQKRFQLPLEYLNNSIIRDLLDMAEEEFGLASNRSITFPCEAELMEYAISLIKKKATRDVEQAFFTSIASSCCSSSLQLQHQPSIHQLPICSF